MKTKAYLFQQEMPEALRVKTVFILRAMGYTASMTGYTLRTNAPAAIAKDCLIYRPSGSAAAEF
jgi:hypothetical protein